MYFLILLTCLFLLREGIQRVLLLRAFFWIALQYFLDLTSFLLKYRKLACIVGEGRKISMRHGKIEVASLNTSHYTGDPPKKKKINKKTKKSYKCRTIQL